MSGTISGCTERRAPRRRLSAEERRESILEAANEVFGEHGYEHVRIDDVAAAAGISKALIYEHFASKQELYMELMNSAALEMLGRARAGGLRARDGGRAADGERAPPPASSTCRSTRTRSTCSCAT